MLVRSVVQDHVHDDADIALLCFSHEPVEVGHGAVLGIDPDIVRDVVAEVNLRRGVDRTEPDGVHAEGLQVVEPARNPVQVTDAVTIKILKAARVDLVDQGMLPPDVTAFRRSRFARSPLIYGLVRCYRGMACDRYAEAQQSNQDHVTRVHRPSLSLVASQRSLPASKA